jgi:hypothetical protein
VVVVEQVGVFNNTLITIDGVVVMAQEMGGMGMVMGPILGYLE